MIPGIEQQVISYSADWGTFNVIVPDIPNTVEDADRICNHLRSLEYYAGIIYKYTHHTKGKRYIGQTMYPRKRHKAHLVNAHQQNPYGVFGKMLKKHGVQNFRYQILEVVYDKDETTFHQLLDEKEKYHIRFHGASVKIYGYNVASGGWSLPSENSVEKPVNMFDSEGNLVRSFKSISDANKLFGFRGPTIRQVCNHVHYTAGGYLWAWAGNKPRLVPEDKIYAYDSNGVYVAEFDNAVTALKILGCSNNISTAIKDKHRMAGGLYWRTYKTDRIPYTDFPKAVFAYDLNGNFVKWFINLGQAKDFMDLEESTGISHAIHNKRAYRGYLWRSEYADHIDPTDGRFINKTPVIAIYPDGSQKRYKMIKDAAADNQISTGAIHRSLKLGTKTAQGILFIRC